MSDLCEEYEKKEYIEKPVSENGIIEIAVEKYVEYCKYEIMKNLARKLLFPHTPMEVAWHIIENVIHDEPIMFDYDTDFLQEVVEHLQILINHRKQIDGMNMENMK